MERRLGKLVTNGLIAAALFLPELSVADQASATLRVSVRVVAACNVSTQPLDFADYTSGGAAVAPVAPGSIDVTCARDVPAAVYLDGSRMLTSAAGNQVAYEVHANGKRWPAGEAIRVKGLGTTAVHLALSGAVPAGQRVAVGQYDNQMVVRVVY
jgi:spore coat protein U-like protein